MFIRPYKMLALDRKLSTDGQPWNTVKLAVEKQIEEYIKSGRGVGSERL